MIPYGSIVGKQDDWANYVTNVEMLETPFLDWLPTGNKPVNTVFSYQAEKFKDPKVNAHIDGQPWTAFQSAGDSRAALKAVVQWFDNTVSVSKLHQDVTDLAGIQDELAREIPKKLKEMSRDMEVAFLDDQDCLEDNGAQGYRTRGVPAWIATGAQTLYPVDSNFRPPSASVSTTATGSLTENVIVDILESIGRETKSSETVTAFVGPKLKRAFSNMPLFTPASTLVGGSPTSAGGVTYNLDLANRAVSRIIERYNSDFGPVELVMSWYNNNLTGNATSKNYMGLFVHRRMWELRWNQKPAVYRPEFKGGSYEAAMDAICMLVCKNPRGEGKYAPTS